MPEVTGMHDSKSRMLRANIWGLKPKPQRESNEGESEEEEGGKEGGMGKERNWK